MIHIKQTEKNVIIIALIHDFIKPFSLRIEDLVPEFDRAKFQEFTEGISFMENNQSVEHALRYLAADTYKRLSKKLSKVKLHD